MYFVRQLCSADRPDFRELRQLALRVNPDDFLMTAEEEEAVPRLTIEAALEDSQPRNCFLGAFVRDSGQLVAIAGLLTSALRKTRHVGHITSLFVHPEHRHRGLARVLMQRLLSQAAAEGLRSIRLEVVAGNRNAISLYETLGFVPYGREPGAYRLGDREWDLALMTCDLANVTALREQLV